MFLHLLYTHTHTCIYTNRSSSTLPNVLCYDSWMEATSVCRFLNKTTPNETLRLLRQRFLLVLLQPTHPDGLHNRTYWPFIPLEFRVSGRMNHRKQSKPSFHPTACPPCPPGTATVIRLRTKRLHQMMCTMKAAVLVCRHPNHTASPCISISLFGTTFMLSSSKRRPVWTGRTCSTPLRRYDRTAGTVFAEKVVMPPFDGIPIF